jgi:predicted Zn-dependent protease
VIGASAWRRTIAQLSRKTDRRGRRYDEVQRAATRIEAVASRDKPAFHWRVTLLRRSEANAYCLPGGKIVVYTGILPVAFTRVRQRSPERRAPNRAHREMAARGRARVHARPRRLTPTASAPSTANEPCQVMSRWPPSMS